MSTKKGPSEGKKVTTENVPPIQETLGPVPADSLAAESARKGGSFASNLGSAQQEGAKKRGSGTEKQPGPGGTGDKTTSLHLQNQQQQRQQSVKEQEQQTRLSLGGSRTTPGIGGGQLNYQAEGQGGTAPSYVSVQHRHEGGPHGKNLHEESSELKGEREGGAGHPLADPGSAEDPARAQLAGMTGLRAGKMPRGQEGQAGGGVGEKTWYSGLEGDEPA
ncbi:hypothetical protein VTJ49DRAFT_6209 [Mycothermus thermophilus]|uniref:Uncharacterized protein n=1 Tax=Humicola insolens TaxID=85995 RepID=A0ABR3V253_HUMIN